MAKEIKEIKTLEERKEALFRVGKEKGYVTFEELADALKGLDVDADVLDEIYSAFEDSEIRILTDEDAKEGNLKEQVEIKILDDKSITKNISINDPVRMYLKEIGKISLLSAEEEIELSKRVVEGDQAAKDLLAE